ncbi:MAG: InlB B-repeat-containing protein, partial [Chitinophagales bacterium]
ANAACSLTENALFTAPADCNSATIVYLVDPVGSGSIDINSVNTSTFPSSIDYTIGANVLLNANNNPNFTFAYWESNVSTINPNINTANTSFNVALNDTIIAHFDNYITDTLWVITKPLGVSTLEIGNDIITSSPFMGIYEVGEILNINATTNGTNFFNQWNLSGANLPDYNANTSFIFNSQDTLYAYFNNILSFENLGEDISSLNIYPSLIENYFTIEINANESNNLNIALYNLAGQKINNLFEGQLNAKQIFKERFEVNLNKGIYLVEINTDKTSIIQKIVIAK